MEEVHTRGGGMVIPDSLTTTGYFYNNSCYVTNFAQLGPKGQLSLNLAIKT